VLGLHAQVCGTENQPVYDIADENRTWRHLDFLEYPCYIHANFTLYFDTLIMTMAKDMPMNAMSSKMSMKPLMK
jgi:5'(3')-deoxyribonucleotidase